MSDTKPIDIEEAKVWFDANAKKASHISDLGLDEEGGGVFAGTLLQLKFGADYDPEIVKKITEDNPGAWTYR